MPLDDNDREHLELLIERSMNRAMKPVVDQITELELGRQRHEQLLTGVNGQNGLNGDVQSLKKFRESVNLRIAWISGAAAAISAIGVKVVTSIIGGK